MKKLIITAALTGAITVPTQSKYLPYTTETIAADAKDFPTHYRLEQIMVYRSAHLARPGERPDDLDGVSTPVFVLDVCGVRLAGRGNHR